MIHYYDTDQRVWKAIENPTAADIAAILMAVRRPCLHCDAGVEMTLADPTPIVAVIHEAGCPDAA